MSFLCGAWYGTLQFWLQKNEVGFKQCSKCSGSDHTGTLFACAWRENSLLQCSRRGRRRPQGSMRGITGGLRILYCRVQRPSFHPIALQRRFLSIHPWGALQEIGAAIKQLIVLWSFCATWIFNWRSCRVLELCKRGKHIRDVHKITDDKAWDAREFERVASLRE